MSQPGGIAQVKGIGPGPVLAGQDRCFKILLLLGQGVSPAQGHCLGRGKAAMPGVPLGVLGPFKSST